VGKDLGIGQVLVNLFPVSLPSIHMNIDVDVDIDITIVNVIRRERGWEV
jgi:hypothetical protein